MSDRLREMTIQERAEQIHYEAHRLQMRIKNLKNRLKMINNNIENIVDNVDYYGDQKNGLDMNFLNDLLGQIESYKLLPIFR